jgi:6-pyruvoyltetrahydropterin/6-carboxytetrahydropterin synthase
MLSRHSERCRFPHGHTRKIEVVVSGTRLDANDMLIDFKALRLAFQDHIDRYDHSMAINSMDPALPEMRARYPECALVVFENTEPTTEALARELFEFGQQMLLKGFEASNYRIAPGQVQLDRVRVWETPSSWAEYDRFTQ